MRTALLDGQESFEALPQIANPSQLLNRNAPAWSWPPQVFLSFRPSFLAAFKSGDVDAPYQQGPERGIKGLAQTARDPEFGEPHMLRRLFSGLAIQGYSDSAKLRDHRRQICWSPHSVNLFVPVGSREAAVKALHSLNYGRFVIRNSALACRRSGHIGAGRKIDSILVRSHLDRIREERVAPLVQGPHEVRLGVDCSTFALKPFSSVGIEWKVSNVVVAGLFPMVDRQRLTIMLAIKTGPHVFYAARFSLREDELQPVSPQHQNVSPFRAEETTKAQ
jgi:hypothetical protein